MKLSSLIVSRPILIFISLAITVLLLPSLVIPCWFKMTKTVKDNVELSIDQFHYVQLSEVGNIAKAVHSQNSTAPTVAKLISSALNPTELSMLDTIIIKMGPLLFQALSTVPHISQISYIGLEGPFLSYYIDGNRIYAVYSNSSFSSSSNARRTLIERNQYTWYKQQVDPNSGKLYGDATVVFPVSMDNNTSWIIQKAINSTDQGYASLGRGWNSGHDPLILNTVGVNGNGVVSLGFSVDSLTSLFSGAKLYGGSMYVATLNGEIFIRGLLDTQMVVNDKSVTFHLLNSSSDDKVSNEVGTVTCTPNDGTSRASLLMFGKAKYMAYCNPVEIFGLQSVFALILPNDDIMARIDHTSNIALILLMVMIGVIIICILSFVWVMIGAKTREMQLCGSLIKQMEATQQAERKSMNKSLAFASASHDIRAALAGVRGLIELCQQEVAPGSELETNLTQMDGCSKDLLDLLNSILDTSKIEAGKMQLQDVEFNLANLLEDVVDLFHPVAAKKGVDMVLDPCDGSILKFSNVRGDSGKLKQVLCNLLSNAVKFTSEGNISIRARAQKPHLENKIIRSNQNHQWKHFLCLSYEKREDYDRLKTMNTSMQNPNTMEFVFEVDDTGAGIPKEKQKSVFENFVQVKETALGQGGTGLGLGIVQSLVRLMGGEIRIVNKENGARGTCFSFNIFLTTLETPSTQNITNGDIETGEDQNQGLIVRTPISTGLTARSTSPRLSMLNLTSKTEGSIVVLLIRNEERRRSTQKFMESLGIKVIVVSHWDNLYSTLMKLKSKQDHSPYSSSGKSEFGSRNEKSSARYKDAYLSSVDESQQPKLPSHHRSSTLRGVPGFVLLVIDATAGPFQELYKVVAEFKGSSLSDSCCRVVWLDTPTRNINVRSKYHGIDSDDEIFLKPFHGSRLYHVIRLLPEFRGTVSSQGVADKEKKEKSALLPSAEQSKTRSSYRHSLQNSDVQAEGSSRHKKRFSESSSSSSRHSEIQRQLVRKHSEIEEIGGSYSTDKPLNGIKFLVAEDSALLQKLAVANLLQLGAIVELCENGEEAVELVRMNLQDQAKHGNYILLPYHYILMDCEMPIMDGYEATRQIRKVESEYGIHIPIIALTAHTSGGDSERTKEAGMDAHLGKPLKKEYLLETIRDLHSN